MSIKAAVDAICSMTVSGVTVYDLDSLPGPVVTLPCLVPVLNYAPGGLEYFTTAEDGRVRMEFEHRLLVSNIQQGLAANRMYNTLTHADTYIQALQADWTLSGALNSPLKVVAISWGPQEWAGALFIGCAFRHEWEIFID